MRKTIAFILSAGLLAAAFTGIACKPRNAKQKALLLAPEPACQVTASFAMREMECYEVEADTYDNAQGPFRDCEDMSGTQHVYELIVPNDGYITYDTCVDDEIVVGIRDNCNAGASCWSVEERQSLTAVQDSVDSQEECYCRYIDGCASDCIPVPAGKYYVVVDSLGSGTSYWVNFCYSSEGCYSNEECDSYCDGLDGFPPMPPYEL